MMKQLVFLLVLATLALSACAAPGAADTPTPTASPVSSATPPAQTGSPTSEPARPTATPSPVAQASGPLPAPLYYLTIPPEAGMEIWQIGRLETDGLTQRWITEEAGGVQYFDVSPADGSLVYVSGLELIRSDAQGENRTVLYTMQDGQAGVHSDVPAALTNPRWSPDGTRVAFALNGINLIAAAGGSAPEVIMPDTYEPNNYEGTRFYRPHSWSPDGTRLLVSYAYYPEGGTYALLDARSGTLTELVFDGGTPCCDPVWTADGRSIYFASAFSFFTDPGLWRIDVATGAVEAIVRGDRGAQRLPEVVVSYVQPAPDGSLYAWRYDPVPGSPPESLLQATPQLARVNLQQAADPAAWEVVSPVALIPTEVRWFPDGRGLVVTAADPNGTTQPPMSWLPTDGGPLLPLPVVGSSPRWARGTEN